MALPPHRLMLRSRPWLLAALAALLTACAGPPEAAAPTATPAPSSTPTPTATPRPSATPTPRPSATPAPTATAEPAAAGEAGDAIAEAVSRTAALDSYRAELSVSGDLGGGGQGSLLSMEGAFAGDAYEFSASGLLPSILGADPARGLQAVRTSDASYVRGPITMIGALEDAWYRLPVQQTTLAAPPVDVRGTLGLLAASGADYGGFQPGLAQQRQGQSCTPYRGDRAATVELLQALAQSGLPGTADPRQVEAAESTILICADGYLHGLDLTFAGENPGDPPVPFRYTLAAALSDHNGAIAIAAPPNPRAVPVGPGAPRP
jgi:hypothetical protein